MEIEYQNHSRRTKKAKEFWLRVARDYMSVEKGGGGLSAAQIVKKYTNPLTRKNYTRAHIYWILNRVSKGVRLL